jgi:uncharacterized membrane protein YhhN
VAFALGREHGEQITIAIAGVLTLVAAGVFLWRLPSLRQMARPVYVRLGILSEGGPVPKDAANEDIENGSSAS